MALAPINYLAQMPQTLGPEQGLAIGSKIQGIRSNIAAREDLELKRQQAQQLKEQYQADLEAAWNNPNKAEAFANLSIKYPQQREAFKQAHSILNEDEQKREIKTTGQVYSALSSGNNDLALSIIDEKITAYENSDQDATDLKQIKRVIETNPENALNMAGMLLSSVMEPDKFVETYGKLGEERRAVQEQPAKMEEYAADLGLKKANTNKVLAETKKLNQEMKKAALELEAMKQGKDIDPEKKFNQEEKLRKEYTSRSKNFSAAQDAFSKIDVSASDQSGAGDIALITSFMKMLDPGSVVRETEFATAQNTAGLLSQLKSAAKKIENGQFLTPEQRKSFSSLAKKYMDAANEQNDKVIKSLDKVVNNYGLNRENVFGTDIEEETPKMSIPTFEQAKARFPNLTLEEYNRRIGGGM